MTPAVRLALAMLVLTAALVSVTTAAAGKGGRSPGVEVGGAGLATVDGAFRYVARHRAGLTTVTAIDRDGRSVRRGSLTGLVGIPRVAFDGSLGGLAHDGRRLVLASPGTVSGRSRFVVLGTRSLRMQRTVVLSGTWSFDALSPDGGKLYLVEHARSGSPTYRVRSYDLVRGTLLREAVIDPRLGGRDDRPAGHAGPRAGRRLGVDALPEAGRASLRPRPRHGAREGALHRAAVAREPGTALRRADARYRRVSRPAQPRRRASRDHRHACLRRPRPSRPTSGRAGPLSVP